MKAGDKEAQLRALRESGIPRTTTLPNGMVVYAHDAAAPDAVAVVVPGEPDTPPAVTDLAPEKFDRVAYMRQYMRAYRARKTKEKNLAKLAQMDPSGPVGPVPGGMRRS